MSETIDLPPIIAPSPGPELAQVALAQVARTAQFPTDQGLTDQGLVNPNQVDISEGSRPLVGFQNHLLDLTGSQSDRYADSVVAILLGEDRERWLLDLSNLRAAAVPSLLAPAFGAPPWVRGITHIQGRVWTVLDTHHLLRGRPGLSRGGWLTLLIPPPESDWALDDPRLALWWSDIVEIAPRSRYTSVPVAAGSSPWVLGQWKDLHGDVWSEMDVARLWLPGGVLERWGSPGS